MRVFGPLGPAVWLLVAACAFPYFKNDISKWHDGFRIDQGHVVGRDFVNVWKGGQIAAKEGAEVVYDRGAYRERLRDALNIKGIYAFSYPPHMLLLSLPFGLVGYFAALIIWTAGGVGLFWYAAKPWLRDAGLPSWIVLVLPASLANIWAGHFGFLISSLALIGWRQATTRPICSGFAFALMTVKPHFGILVPPILLVFRCWKAIFWAAVLTAFLLACSVMVFGAESWRQWLGSTLPFQASLLNSVDKDMNYIYMMPTAERFARSFTQVSLFLFITKITFSATAIWILFWSWRKRVGMYDLALLSFVSIFLIIPYSFIYDMVGACLAVIIFAARWRDRLSTVENAILAAAFIAPLLHMPFAKMGFAYGPLALLGALIVAARHMAADAEAERPAA
jgi:hypothetical protein